MPDDSTTAAGLLLIALSALSHPSRDIATTGSRSDRDGSRIVATDAPVRDHLAPGARHWVGKGKGAGISVYVVDTGVVDVGIFESFQSGYPATGAGARGCGEGHGTQVASLIAGRGYGVAESATIVPVQVLDCGGSGAKAAVVEGLKWVVAHASPATSVVNLSFGTRRDRDIDALVAQLTRRAIPVVIAAGNGGRDSARYSPSGMGCDNSLSIVVAASTETDVSWPGSNYGACVSIHAPGVDLPAYGAKGETTVTGTSFAASYVSGAIAAYASECAVTTPEAWMLILAHAAPAIDVGRRVTTTTRRLPLFSSPGGRPSARTTC